MVKGENYKKEFLKVTLFKRNDVREGNALGILACHTGPKEGG